jgi:hypothetical protein
VKGMEAAAYGVTMSMIATDQDREREKRRRAARTVAALAHDANDCAYLLDALGLHAAEGLAHH